VKVITHTIAASVLAFVLTAAGNGLSAETGAGAHVFILSGQSNMAGLKSDRLFTPIVEKAFGEDNVIVVRKAWSGRPIRVWYNHPMGPAHLYEKMMTAVTEEVKGRKIATVTFIWMQGETDAGEKKSEAYEACLTGLLAEVKKDLGIERMNVVIGRICDYDKEFGKNPHWEMVRDIQVKVGESGPEYAWVDTDDLNNKPDKDGKTWNALHYTGAGYETLGKRFADKAIELINNQ
jgi:hypothetical protein